MRRLVTLMTVVLLSLPYVGNCAQATKGAEKGTGTPAVSTEVKAVSAFEKRVQIFENFFENRPKFLDRESNTTSPSGSIYIWYRYDNSQIDYEIQKSRSQASPFTGIINVTFLNVPGLYCGGDFEPYPGNRFFSTPELARPIRERDSCFIPGMQRGAKFIFAFQKGGWVLKDVRSAGNNASDRLRGLATGDILPDNMAWKVLATGTYPGQTLALQHHLEATSGGIH